MTDQDLIRRCVELAKGWTTRPHNADLIIESRGGYAGAWSDPEMKDMLAAQLVRQVHDDELHTVTTHVDHTVVERWEYGVSEILVYAEGVNITLNTLRAIDEFYRRQGDD